MDITVALHFDSRRVDEMHIHFQPHRRLSTRRSRAVMTRKRRTAKASSHLVVDGDGIALGLLTPTSHLRLHLKRSPRPRRKAATSEPLGRAAAALPRCAVRVGVGISRRKGRSDDKARAQGSKLCISRIFETRTAVSGPSSKTISRGCGGSS